MALNTFPVFKSYIIYSSSCSNPAPASVDLATCPIFFVLCKSTLQGLLPFPAPFKCYFSLGFRAVLPPCLLPRWSAVTNLHQAFVEAETASLSSPLIFYLFYN